MELLQDLVILCASCGFVEVLLQLQVLQLQVELPQDLVILCASCGFAALSPEYQLWIHLLETLRLTSSEFSIAHQIDSQESLLLFELYSKKCGKHQPNT